MFVRKCSYFVRTKAIRLKISCRSRSTSETKTVDAAAAVVSLLLWLLLVVWLFSQGSTSGCLADSEDDAANSSIDCMDACGDNRCRGAMVEDDEKKETVLW